MNFSQAGSAVQSWLDDHESVSLIFTDESDQKMYFASTDGVQFFIEFPTSKSNKWTIGSECDAQEFLKSAKSLCAARTDLSVTEILDSVCFKTRNAQAKPRKADDDDDDDDVEEYGDDDYYDESYAVDDGDDDDDDVTPDRKTAESPKVDEEEFSRYAHLGNQLATKRLLTDMKSLQSSEGKFGISGTPRDDNLYVWDVKLTDLDPKSRLGQDLQTYAKKFKRENAIYLEMTFQETYPMTPPFVRVLRPRFKFLTGHVTIGGSICMQMLTRSGWSPGNDIESILIQIRSEIMSDPEASLDLNADREYTEHEAKDAFNRMVARYKWN